MHTYSSLQFIKVSALTLVLSLTATTGEAQNLHWNAAGTPSDSFELTDGPIPGAQPGDQVFTASNTCDSSTVRATFSNPDGVADPGEPFVGLRAADTVDWWIEGTTFDDPSTSANDARHTLTLEFLGDPVEDLQFTIFDLDYGSWEDQYLVTGEFVGAVNVNVTACGSSMACSGSGTTQVTATGQTGATFGAAAGNLVVTIPGPVQIVTLVYQVGPTDTDTTTLNGDQLTGISDFSFSCSTVPVTLASFLATPRGRRTEFAWTTATETSNVGFHIYGEIDGDWQRLNQRLIPSQSVDSLEPRSYGESLAGRGARRFVIADVDTRGKEAMHGPFDLGVESGVPAVAESIDWQPIRERRAELAAERRNELAGELDDRRAAMIVPPTPLATPPVGAFKAAAAPEQTAPAATQGYELRVADTGLYRVPFESVAGLAGAPLQSLALTHGGQPIEIHVESADASGVFGPGAFIEFYGESLETLYSRTNVYQLSVDRRSALRARRTAGVARSGRRPARSYRAESRVENDVVYSFASPNGDPWYETSILAYDEPVSKSFEFEVDQIGAGRAHLLVDLWGVTDWSGVRPDHHVVISLNGSPVADHWFDGLSEQSLEIPLTRGQLIEGTNELTISSRGDTGARYDLIHVDGYGASYGRRFVASDDRFAAAAVGQALLIEGFSSDEVVAYRHLDGRLVRLTGAAVSRGGNGTHRVKLAATGRNAWTYLVSTVDGLMAPEIAPLPELQPIATRRADYVIISHPDFLDGLGRLVNARRRDGLSVKVVDVEQIYLQYGGGIFDPEAIRRFIADSIENLGGRYFLLVGGDSYDYHDHLGIGSVSFIPTIYMPTHAVVSFAPADSALADADLDGTPDAAIGRFPVRTATELETLIDKTLRYTSGSRHAIFAADEHDGAYSFGDISNELAGHLSSMTVETAYLDELGVAGARRTLLDAVNAGAAITHYFGHSGPAGWTFSGLLGSADAATLENHGNPTVALQWGCWGGYHSVPRFDTLSHRLLLSGPQGAAAVLGASSLTEVASDRAMAQRVYQHLAVPGTRLGDAILLAKADLGASYRDVILSMTLLGDPALVID